MESLPPDQQPPPGLREPGDAPSGDGMSNLLKYALGLNPMTPSRDGAPRLVLKESSQPVLAVELIRSVDAEVQLQLEYSTDLSDWTPIEFAVEHVEQIDPERERIRLLSSISPKDPGNHFLRHHLPGQTDTRREPVNGFIDLVFRLYDSAVEGNTIGTPFAADDVEVEDGVFTLVLDFGEGAFTGDDRWVEIEVEGTALAPRQPITAAPMAHFAHRAGSVPGAAMFMQVGDTAVLQGDVRIGELENLQALRVWGRFASGRNASIGGFNSFVGGGDENSARGTDSFVGGGGLNKTEGANAFVGGGRSNTARGINSFVGGGRGNGSNGENSFVGGGNRNSASGERGFVGGGILNVASGLDSFVAGGGGNAASGEGSMVAGGGWNMSSGFTSFAAGYFAGALHDGAFVWADSSTDTDFTSTGNHQFLIRATGGVGIGTAPERDFHIRQGEGDAVLPGIQLESSEHTWALYIDKTGDLVFEANGEIVARVDANSGSAVTASIELEERQKMLAAENKELKERLTRLEMLVGQ